MSRCLAAVATVALLAAGCTPSPQVSASAPAPGATTPSVSAPVSSPSAPSTASPAAPSSSAAPAAVELKATFTDTTSTPNGEKVNLTRGQKVNLTLTNHGKKALEMHNHLDDAEYTVEAGQTMTFTFVAEKSGRFELETHHPAIVVFMLIVR